MHPTCNVIAIAGTGGPGSGKTSMESRLKQALENIGVICVMNPESATLAIKAGITPWDLSIIDFQEYVSQLQISNERIFGSAARELAEKHGKRVVLFCDRGLLDQAAYLPGPKPLAQLDEMLRRFGLSVEEARTRYGGVIHLVTAADGAEEHYTLANNSARTETPEQARALDQRTLDAWLGHSHLAVVGNVDRMTGARISFDEKMRRAIAEIFRILGYPQPLEIEDKYLLESFDPALLPVSYEMVGIEQTYLVPDESGSEERVRSRRWLATFSYYHTVKKPGPDGARIEIERLVDAKEYRKLLGRADPARKPVLKKRYCFVWNQQYFEADVFEGRHEGLFLLERERTDRNDSTELPPFVRVIKDVTHDKTYKNAALAASF